MKVGLHFNADHESLGSFYGYAIYEEVFKLLLDNRKLSISSKIFVGDLLFVMFSSDASEQKTEFGYSTAYAFNPEKYDFLFNSWLSSEENNWRKFDDEKLSESYNQNIFVVCFESIDLRTTEFLCNELKDFAPFIGAMEVIESNEVHWSLYTNSLVPYARIINKRLFLFHDSYNSDDLDTEMQKEYIKLGFESVVFEDLKFRYTIFDKYNNFEQVRRIAEWKKGFGSFLAHIADDVVSKLIDTAPELGNKLWSALNTFESAETNEQYAQVVTSCRRIFEYVTDCILPASNEKSEDGHSLKADKYKNRIFEYAKKTRLSSTNIDLINASTDTLFYQWEKLNNLANKGVHSDVFRDETRRCLIRTVLLLDDIVSLNDNPFEMKTEINFEL